MSRIVIGNLDSELSEEVRAVLLDLNDKRAVVSDIGGGKVRVAFEGAGSPSYEGLISFQDALIERVGPVVIHLQYMNKDSAFDAPNLGLQSRVPGLFVSKA